MDGLRSALAMIDFTNIIDSGEDINDCWEQHGKTHSLAWCKITSQRRRSGVEILPLGLMEVLLFTK